MNEAERNRRAMEAGVSLLAVIVILMALGMMC